jgi:hypothetical protein
MGNSRAQGKMWHKCSHLVAIMVLMKGFLLGYLSRDLREYLKERWENKGWVMVCARAMAGQRVFDQHK